MLPKLCRGIIVTNTFLFANEKVEKATIRWKNNYFHKLRILVKILFTSSLNVTTNKSQEEVNIVLFDFTTKKGYY